MIDPDAIVGLIHDVYVDEAALEFDTVVVCSSINYLSILIERWIQLLEVSDVFEHLNLLLTLRLRHFFLLFLLLDCQ